MGNERLEAFEKFWKMLWPNFGSLDWDDFTDAAEKAGLIRVVPHDPDTCEVDGCPCDGWMTEMYWETKLANPEAEEGLTE